MKNKFYIFYIIFLIVLLFTFLTVWPDRWINIDIGSFHYHKLWEGPSLASLTLEKLQSDLDIKLGRDFEGSKQYKLKIVFDEGEVNREYTADEITELISKRLTKAKIVESDVYWERGEEEYYIYVELNASISDFESVEGTIFNLGDLSIWGEKGEEASDEEINLEEDSNPLRSYLKQNYTNLNINANEIKSYSVGSADDSYFIKLALKDEQCTSLSEQVYSFWGSSLIAVLDDQVLPLDGQELAKQLEYYKQVKGVKIAGIASKELADIYGATIMYGPLSHELEIISSDTQSPKYGKEFLDNVIVSGLGSVVSISIISILLFRKKGFLFVIGIVLFCLLVITSLKLSPIRLTVMNIFTFLFGLGLFLYCILKGMVSRFDMKDRTIELCDGFLSDSDNKRHLRNLVSIILLSSLISEFISVWDIKNISRVFAICAISIWILYMYVLPFLDKFISIAKSDFQKN